MASDPRSSLRKRLHGSALHLAIAGLLALPLTGLAGEAQPIAADPVLEARMLLITSELRCLVCQNQTVADSHAALAEDLRQKVRELLADGDSNQQVIDYMTARYGDFVLYRPPVKASTALLWFGPALLLLGALAALFVVLRRRGRLGPEQFDADADADADADTDTNADGVDLDPAPASSSPSPSKEHLHGA